MKKLGWAGFVVAALMLTGCSAAVEDADVAPEVAKSAPVETPSATPTAAPIEMEDAPIDPTTPWGEAGYESADAWYLASMDMLWQGDRPSDVELLGAGMLACEQMASGAERDSITVVTGESADATLNNKNAVIYAWLTLCP